MDYNFYVAQTAAKPDPAHSAIYEQQMLDTYLRYFQASYEGNRAPIHIGHHFSTWNGGAYWRALQRFAATVCGMPEVKCVTYRELSDFMDSVSPEIVAAYRKGDFEKAVPSRPKLAQGKQGRERESAHLLSPEEFEAMGLQGDVPEAHEAYEDGHL
jgi:hypothetical protein